MPVCFCFTCFLSHNSMIFSVWTLALFNSPKSVGWLISAGAQVASIKYPQCYPKGFGWCALFCGEVLSIFWFKFRPRDYLGHFYPTLSGDNLPPKGNSNSDGGLGASSAFLYTIAGGDARVLIYFTCLFCTFFSIARSKTHTTQYALDYSANPI